MLDRGNGAKSIGTWRRALCATVALLALGLLASTAAVAAPPSLTIASPSAGGWSKSSTPAFTGTTDDGIDAIAVRIYAGDAAEGTPVATLEATPMGDAWETQDATSLPDGPYAAVAEQVSGEEPGTSVPVTFTVDTTKPAVTLAPLASISKDSTPSFSGTAGTEPGDLATVEVFVYSGTSATGTPLGSVGASASGGSWTVTPTTVLPDGTYTAVAEQSDEAGNVGASEPSTFTIDTKPPNVTLAPISALIRESTPTFTGTVGTAPHDVGAVVVDVYAGATVSGTPIVGVARVNGGEWSYTTPSLADGTYTVQASQSDEAGNVGESQPPRTFTVDSTAPAVTLTPLPPLINSAKPTFSGAAGTASGDEPSVTLTIYDGTAPSGAPVQMLKTTPNGAGWSVSAKSSLADGTYTAVAQQPDEAGNVGTSESSTFTIKTKGPPVSLEPVPAWTNERQPTFSGAAGTEAGARSEVTLEIYPGTKEAGSKPIRSVAALRSGSGWTAGPAQGLEALPDGTYTAEAVQFDEASNRGGSIARTFTVDTVAPAPTLSLAAPGANESGVDEIVSGAAGAAPGDRRQVTVELFSGASAEPASEVEAITVNAVAGAWSARLAGLAPGEYTVQARQSDEAGNVGTSAAGSFTVAAPASSPQSTTQAPVSSGSSSPPVASFTWAPTNPTVGQVVSLASSSTDLSSSIGSYAWDLGGGQLAPGGPTATTSFATPGSHVVRLQVTDGNGLSSTVAQTISVAPAPPQLMQPFPIVRIAGSETSYGVYVKLLTVQAPVGASVQVACVGRACKTKAETRIAVAAGPPKVTAGAVTLTFKRFERALRAGVTLQIRVTKPGLIGKFTSFAIRRGKLPVRADACLATPSAKPSPCPSS